MSAGNIFGEFRWPWWIANKRQDVRDIGEELRQTGLNSYIRWLDAGGFQSPPVVHHEGDSHRFDSGLRLYLEFDRNTRLALRRESD